MNGEQNKANDLVGWTPDPLLLIRGLSTGVTEFFNFFLSPHSRELKLPVNGKFHNINLREKMQMYVLGMSDLMT